MLSVNKNETTTIGNGMSVIEEDFSENDLRQVWIRGNPDEKGYFKISNPDSKMFLTGPYKNGLSIEGEENYSSRSNTFTYQWSRILAGNKYIATHLGFQMIYHLFK